MWGNWKTLINLNLLWKIRTFSSWGNPANWSVRSENSGRILPRGFSTFSAGALGVMFSDKAQRSAVLFLSSDLLHSYAHLSCHRILLIYWLLTNFIINLLTKPLSVVWPNDEIFDDLIFFRQVNFFFVFFATTWWNTPLMMTHLILIKLRIGEMYSIKISVLSFRGVKLKITYLGTHAFFSLLYLWHLTAAETYSLYPHTESRLIIVGVKLSSRHQFTPLMVRDDVSKMW